MFEKERYKFDDGDNKLIGIYGANTKLGDLYMTTLGFITSSTLECRPSKESDSTVSETTGATET